ncbi:MAG: type IV pilus assembly protein PilM [Candidatus Uhrbacteria bacterium]
MDIGMGGVKVVEFRSDRRRARLSTYGVADIVVSANADVHGAGANIADPERTAALLRDVCSRAKVETTRAVASLPIADVFSSVITLPMLPEKDLPAAVSWEAKKLVPLPIEEMVIDWKVLPPSVEPMGASSPSANEKTRRVLLTGAPKTVVERYVDVFRRAGLNLVSLETEAFALIRSLVGDDLSAVLILDIGAARTSLIVVDHGTPVFNRSIDVGGRHFTEAIARATGCAWERAEEVKLDLVTLPTANAATAALPRLTGEILAPVVQEVRYGLNLYHSQDPHGGRVVEKIILAGGTALLPSLSEYLARTLELRVFVGDPWARVIYPIDLRPALDAIGPRFAVAVGLAMREIT